MSDRDIQENLDDCDFWKSVYKITLEKCCEQWDINAKLTDQVKQLLKENADLKQQMDVKTKLFTEEIRKLRQENQKLVIENAGLKHRMSLLEKQVEHKPKGDWQYHQDTDGFLVWTCKNS